MGDAQQTAVWKGQWINLSHRSPAGQLQLIPGKAADLAKPSRATSQIQFVPNLPQPQKVLSSKAERFLTMMVAGDVAFVAGSEGPAGAKKHFLWSFRCEDLSPIGKIALPAEPTHRGLIACGDRLYLSCTDGSVVCLAPAP